MDVIHLSAICLSRALSWTDRYIHCAAGSGEQREKRDQVSSGAQTNEESSASINVPNPTVL